MKRNRKGWFGERERHRASAYGIETAKKTLKKSKGRKNHSQKQINWNELEEIDQSLASLMNLDEYNFYETDTEMNIQIFTDIVNNLKSDNKHIDYHLEWIRDKSKEIIRRLENEQKIPQSLKNKISKRAYEVRGDLFTELIDINQLYEED